MYSLVYIMIANFKSGSEKCAGTGTETGIKINLIN